MVTEKKRIEISNWIEYATKSWETEGEASLYTIDEALKAMPTDQADPVSTNVQ